ncbi:MAG: hypothetical protein BGN88_09930 [Clostridiales bacterium 43-6]|nr:MAG: hypothetical protein BGN88_09930 [Clostridiales bacterium 43-6]
MFNDKSPYKIRIKKTNNSNQYFVSFIDGQDTFQELELSHSMFIEIHKIIKDIRNLKRSDERHIEKFDLSDEQLLHRAFNPPMSIEDEAIIMESMKTLNEALSRLPEIQKRRVILYYKNHLTFEQIAEMEGCKHPAVIKSVNQALKKIKKYFDL